MNNILILYPSQFKCSGKFERKLSSILQNIDSFSILFKHDKNNLISDFFTTNFPEVKLVEDIDLKINEITHAIIFDDGEEFFEETKLIENNEIPLRKIRIKITRVINIKENPQYKNQKSTQEYEYIGRGSYWGNPYSMYESGEDRDEVIRKYKYDFDFDLFPNKEKSKIYELAGKKLGCFCKPAS